MNTAQGAAPNYFVPNEPCVGNIFAYGLDPANNAAGAVPSVRESGGSPKISKTLQCPCKSYRMLAQ